MRWPAASGAADPRRISRALTEPVIARLVAATDTGLIRSLCSVLAQWRPTTHRLVGILSDLLARDDVWPAAGEALGRIGHPTDDAIQALRRRALREARDPTAAWAWFRLTGDAVAADLLVRMVADQPRHATVRYLADLGPPAFAAIPRLAELAAAADQWPQVEAASTHWRLSGDPSLAVATLTAVIRPLAQDAGCLPVQRDARRCTIRYQKWQGPR